MPDNEHESPDDLIQRIVDGEATPAERATLDVLMRDSASTRADYERLRDLVRRLDTYPLAEAPGLRDEILARLRGGNVVPLHVRKRRAIFGLAWAAAAVVIIGIGLDQFRRREHVDPGQSAATMVKAPETGVPSWPVIARQSAEGTRLTVRASGELIAVMLEPVTAGTSLIWEPDQLISSPEGAGRGYDRGNIQSGVAAFSAPADRATVLLRRVRDGRGPVFVRLDRDGQEIVRVSIPR